MTTVAVITGVTGQDGANLADFLLRKKYKVIGIATALSTEKCWRLDYFKIRSKITLIEGSILNQAFVKKIIARYQPHELYNLAGQSSVGKSWRDPVGTVALNGLAVVGLLEAVRSTSSHTRFFQASSAEIYGNSAPLITEQTSTYGPLNPYGAGKLVAHCAVKNFRAEYGLFAVNGILFNHESPLRDPYFVTKVIARGVADIAAGKKNRLTLGNLATWRDYGNVADFVRAMWLMLQNKRPDDFIICTGESHSVKEFADEAFRAAGIKNWKDCVESKPGLLRRQEVKKMRGSPAKIKRVLGWKPTVTFKQLVKMLVDYEIKNHASA